ncbi:hypothetical protein CRG98_024740 [Punica granatum]|uniref:Uncharacterized protein n=1 Tax=Punica granatum TaxID=22663 RepID=A0A2I0JF39_PUNGR|nr:hypothetical protein CRG98_024740 [Punica granatum]
MVTHIVTYILRQYIDCFYKPEKPIVKFHKDVQDEGNEFLFQEWKGKSRANFIEKVIWRSWRWNELRAHTLQKKKPTGLEPSMTGMFENYHRQKGDKQWVSSYAVETHEKVTQAASQGTDASLQSDLTQAETWRKVVRTNKKGRTYGLNCFLARIAPKQTNDSSEGFLCPHFRQVDFRRN